MRKLFFLTSFLLAIFCFANMVFPGMGEPRLFTKVAPKRSKIRFENTLKDTKEHNIMLYSNYYGGAGVGIGDLNNDGLADIFFAGNLVADKLYLNRGHLEFEDITREAGIIDDGGWSSGVLIADVNQDGWQDIYVTRELYDDAPQLRRNLLYINNKDNSFTERAEAYNLADTARTRHATFLDYDKDGDLDLFLLNQPPNPGDYSRFYNTPLLLKAYRPRLMRNEGGAAFTEVSETAGFNKTGFPNSVTASDLNGDGWTDLYVANDFWVGDWYYINNGDGTFTDKIHDYARHISFSSMGVDAADINNDGLLDICVVDMAAEDNYRSKANMSGMNPEAFWKVVNDGDHYQYMFNTLQLNIGEGQLSDIAQLADLATTDWSWSVLMADLDNDSWKDVFVTNGLMRDIRNKDASKTFPDYLEAELYKYLQKNPNPGKLSIWDIVDIDKALALVPSQKLQNYVFQNRGDLRFVKRMKEWGLDEKTFSNGAAYGDLDNDGDLDLVVNNINDPASLYENHASEMKKHHYLRVNPLPEKPGMTTLGTKIWVTTRGGQQFFELTSVRGMYSTSEQIAHFGLGPLSDADLLVEEVRVRWPDGKEAILTKVPVDQTIDVAYELAGIEEKPEIVLSKPLLTKINEQIGLQHRHEENEFDDYLTQVLLPHKMSGFGPCLASGDVNGDGLDDFYIGGAVTKAGSLYLQNADETATSLFRASSEAVFLADKIHEDLGAAFFDAEGDGDLDLYVVSGGNEFLAGAEAYQDRLYLNDGSGNFIKKNDWLPEMRYSGSKVIPADFDHDGDPDLLVAGRHIPWAYPEAASSVLLINEGGKFVDSTSALAPALREIGMVNDASWIDYDGDGWKDLVLIGEWMAPTFLHNRRGKLFRETRSLIDAPAKGWWFSLESADMDGDGDEDMLAGNLGLNYKYKASPEAPFEVYYSDFDGNKSKDIVLTYYNYGIQYPLRGRQCSSEQIPSLKEKIPTYDIFASSNVGQIYGADNLDKALHYEATTFASSYFENLGDGHFALHPLPVMAQLSSVNDFVVDDFDGDGQKDVLLAGNLYDAEVETTRNDAGYGLLLKGKGKGRLSVISREESGFFVPCDAKSVISLQSRMGKLILVGCNNELLQIYRVKDHVDK